jgi:hypothetical protein
MAPGGTRRRSRNRVKSAVFVRHIVPMVRRRRGKVAGFLHPHVGVREVLAQAPSVFDISMAELTAHELDAVGECARFSPHGGAGCGENGTSARVSPSDNDVVQVE